MGTGTSKKVSVSCRNPGTNITSELRTESWEEEWLVGKTYSLRYREQVCWRDPKYIVNRWYNVRPRPITG